MTLREIGVQGGRVFLLGTVQGLASEAEVVRAAFERARPAAVAIGVGAEGVAAILAYLKRAPPDTEDAKRQLEEESAEDLSDADVGYGFALNRFGKVLLPPRCYVEAVRLARESSLPLEGADFSEEEYETVFTKNVGAIALLRYSRRARRLSRSPPEESTARDFALAWDRELTSIKAYGNVERAREARMAERARDIASERGSVLLVVEAARETGVAAALQA